MITRRFFVGGLVAAPVVMQADRTTKKLVSPLEVNHERL